MKKRVTIVDIALEAGLSTAQAARALSERGAVKPATREHVRSVALRLGYRVNHAARKLASKHSRDIGVVIGEPLNPFHIIMAGAVDARLSARGLVSVMSLRGPGAPSLFNQIEHLLTLGVAGVILISTEPNKGLVAAIAELVPTVYFGQEWPDIDVTTLSLDDDALVGIGIGHLIALGHQRIAHIEGGDWPGAEGRRRGYTLAMEKAGLTPLSIPGGHGLDDGRNGVDQLALLGPMPTAIFADNDISAIGVINRLFGRGLHVPKDVSVLGFDDIPDAASETMSLSTFRQDSIAHAKALVAAVEKRIKHPNIGPISLKGEAKFIIRSSVAAVGAPNADPTPHAGPDNEEEASHQVRRQ